MDGGWLDLQGKKVLSLIEMKGKNIFSSYITNVDIKSFTLNKRTNFSFYETIHIWFLVYTPPPFFFFKVFSFVESVLELNTNIFQFQYLTALTWCFMSWLDSIVLITGTVKWRRKRSCFQILTKTATGGWLLLLQLIHWLAQASQVTDKFIWLIHIVAEKKKLN